MTDALVNTWIEGSGGVYGPESAFAQGAKKMPESFLKKIGNWLLDRGIDFGEETLEELAQSSSSGIFEIATGTPASETTFAQEYGTLEDAANTELTILITVGLFGLSDLNSSKVEAITQAYEQGNLELAATMTAEEIDKIVAQNTASAADAEIFKGVRDGLKSAIQGNTQTSQEKAEMSAANKEIAGQQPIVQQNIEQQNPSVNPQTIQQPVNLAAQGVQQNIQAQSGDVVTTPQIKIDPNAVSEPEVQNSVKNTAQEIKALSEETQTDIFNDDVKKAFYQFRINPTNINAETFYNTSIQNIDSAIAAEQQIGADTSALAALRGKMESLQSEAAQAKPNIEAQTKRAETERSMTKAVSMLTNLPADVQAEADAGAARQALYDYMKADESGKAAAHDKVVRVLKGSISSALEAKGLDTGTRQTLEEVLAAIDVQAKSGYNNEQAAGDSSYANYLRMMDKMDAANKAGMSTKEFAESLGVTSTYTDEDAEAADAVNYRMLAGEGKNKFTYKNNPMDNPKAVKDIVENPNAVYGYSPDPKSESIGGYADSINWGNPEEVAQAVKRREAYHNENDKIVEIINKMSEEGYSTEEIARAAIKQRNLNRYNDYIDDPDGLRRMMERNKRKYGSVYGPTAEFLYNKYGSWEKVIEKTMSLNPGMDACCGLYDKYYYLYPINKLR